MITSFLHALAPIYVLAGLQTCQPPNPPPQVQMEFNSAAPLLRGDLTSHELGAFHVSTTFSHSQNEIFTVGGLTLSEFGPEYMLDFETLTDPATGLACLSVKSIKIKVDYAPTVYIASEFHEGSCRYVSTLEHEARHVDTDIITFNQLLPELQQTVQAAANNLGSMGPLSPENLIPARDALVERIKQSLVGKADEIEQVRSQRQQAIDTRQEYMRLSEMCAGEPIPMP